MNEKPDGMAKAVPAIEQSKGLFMNIFCRSGLCFLMVLVAISVRAEDNPVTVLSRAEQLVSLRDRIVAEYGSWSEEYAKEDTEFAKQAREHYGQFLKRLNVEATPPPAQKERPGLQLRFVSVTSLLSPGYDAVGRIGVLDFSSSQLKEGPDVPAAKQESAQYGTSLIRILARDVGKTGDMAFLDDSILIPSGRFANLGNVNLHYLSGVELSERVQDHDPLCMVRNNDLVLIETSQKKYALVQYVGGYQRQPLLAVAYQPNGSAVFEFGSLPRVRDSDYRRTDIKPQDVGAAMFLQGREIFFSKEVQAITRPLKNVENDAGLSESQRERVKQIKKNLGIVE